MEKVSSLVSKKVISLEEGKSLGYVLDLVFDDMLKCCQGVIVADDENENTFFLSCKAILSEGEECVMVESERVLEFDISSQSNNPIGKKVYDEKGVNLGTVCDVVVSGKNVKKIITKKCEIPQKYIKKSGINYIIFGIYKNNKKNKRKPIFKEKESAGLLSDKLPKVVASSNEIIQEKRDFAEIDNTQMRLFASPNFLLGRTITKDLFGMNNEIIARKNEKISKKTINLAKNHNKLNFLAYFSQ